MKAAVFQSPGRSLTFESVPDPAPMLSATTGFDGFAAMFDALWRDKRECKVLLRPDA